jgi:hypothetical protein
MRSASTSAAENFRFVSPTYLSLGVHDCGTECLPVGPATPSACPDVAHGVDAASFKRGTGLQRGGVGAIQKRHLLAKVSKRREDLLTTNAPVRSHASHPACMQCSVPRKIPQQKAHVRADLSNRCDVCADSTGDARVARAEHPEQCLVAERIGDARERAAISTAWTTFHAEVTCHTEVTWSAVATAAARSPAHQRICHLQLP